MIRFSGGVWFWKGPAPFYFVTVPDEESDRIEEIASAVTYGWGMVPVHVTIGDTQWSTALFPKNSGYIVPLKDAVRRAEGIVVGSAVTMRLTVDV